MPLQSRPIGEDSMCINVRSLSPIFNGLPRYTEADPYGLLPWLRRIRKERGLILEWTSRLNELIIWYWYAFTFVFCGATQ